VCQYGWCQWCHLSNVSDRTMKERARRTLSTMGLILVHNLVDLRLDFVHHSGHDCCSVWVGIE
jgi:hypothetical protein